MKSFIDKNGETWDLELNIGTAMRLQSRLNINIENCINLDSNKPKEISLLERITEDSILLFNIIYVLCETQVRERGLTEEEFAERFSGDTIAAATDALLDEIENFSRPAKRKILKRLRQISQEISDEAGEKMDQLFEDPKFKEALEAALQKLSTNSPEFSE